MFDLLGEMPQKIGYRTEDDGVDLVIDADPNRDKYGHVVEGWRAALSVGGAIATPEELDTLELPFDWHSACVVTTEPDPISPEDRNECQRLADIPIRRRTTHDFDAVETATLVAHFVSDALNAFVDTSEGLGRWREVLAALDK